MLGSGMVVISASALRAAWPPYRSDPDADPQARRAWREEAAITFRRFGEWDAKKGCRVGAPEASARARLWVFARRARRFWSGASSYCCPISLLQGGAAGCCVS